jgi:hypothetical protein
MWMRWRLVLPVVGLILFGMESYSSYRFNQQLGTPPRKYYWWSSIRLDTDPLNKNPKVSTPRKSGEEDGGWDPVFLWIDQGYLPKTLMLSALPAFALGGITVGVLAHVGINEVWSFMLLMPVFLFGWFYFVGWPVDRWLRKRRRATALAPD